MKVYLVSENYYEGGTVVYAYLSEDDALKRLNVLNKGYEDEFSLPYGMREIEVREPSDNKDL